MKEKLKKGKPSRPPLNQSDMGQFWDKLWKMYSHMKLKS